MPIYVDEIREYPGKGNWCHMWTDGTDEELDAAAKTLGLKKEWAHLSQGVSGRFYHYDLRPNKRAWALRMGAVFKPLHEWIKERFDFSKMLPINPQPTDSNTDPQPEVE